MMELERKRNMLLTEGKRAREEAGKVEKAVKEVRVLRSAQQAQEQEVEARNAALAAQTKYEEVSAGLDFVDFELPEEDLPNALDWSIDMFAQWMDCGGGGVVQSCTGRSTQVSPGDLSGGLQLPDGIGEPLLTYEDVFADDRGPKIPRLQVLPDMGRPVPPVSVPPVSVPPGDSRQ
eukprot:jgi/Botrbrau1/21651/Bobra.43_1s0052.1